MMMILSSELFVRSPRHTKPSLFKRFIFFIGGSIFSLIIDLWIVASRFTTSSITRSTSSYVIRWFCDSEWSVYAIPLFKKLVHLNSKIFRNSERERAMAYLYDLHKQHCHLIKRNNKLCKTEFTLQPERSKERI